MKVNSNIQAMVAQGILHNNEERYRLATEKLSSGYKINTAIDNPSGMAISNKMNAQLKSLKKANQNTNNAVNVCRTADGALGEIEDILQRMNELAVKSSNGTNTSEDRKAIQVEIEQLTKEISRIGRDTEYNTQPILDGTQDLKGYTNNTSVKVRSYNTQFPFNDYKFNADGSIDPNPDGNVKVEKETNKKKDGTEYTTYKYTTPDGGEMILDVDKDYDGSEVTLNVNGVGGMKIQVGSAQNQEILVNIPAVSLRHLGLGDMDNKLLVDCGTEKGARESIDMIKGAISYISAARSSIGAIQNRLEDTISNLNVTEENLTDSYSAIKDVDMAEEMVNYTTLQVLVQAGTSMLTQANEQPQQALQLLQ